MRVVLDTNILISALMVQTGNPAAIYRAWQEGYFTLLTCAEHLDELGATLRKPAVAERIKPYKAGSLVTEIKVPAALGRFDQLFDLARGEVQPVADLQHPPPVFLGGRRRPVFALFRPFIILSRV